MIKIEALYRLRAMPITIGDNYSLGIDKSRQLLTGGTYNIKYITHNNDIVLLSRKDNLDSTYMIAILSKPIEKLKENLGNQEYHGSLKSAGIKYIIGTLVVGQRVNNPDIVDSIWIAKQYRGKGYGKGLYMTGYKYSKHGLQSSDDLGTLSLAAWLSLYKTYKKIYVMINGRPVSRKDIEIQGQKLLYDDSNLVNDVSHTWFTFIWPK